MKEALNDVYDCHSDLGPLTVSKLGGSRVVKSDSLSQTTGQIRRLMKCEANMKSNSA